MRAALVIAAAVAATGASASATPFHLFDRQTGIAGCEDQCNPVMDWAYTCRTDVNKCMEECNAELMAMADSCIECMKTTNPAEAAAITARVDSVRQMCGGEGSGSAAGGESSAAAESSAAPESSAEAAASLAPAAASSGSAVPAGSSAPAASSGASAASSGASASAPAASTPAASTPAGSDAGKATLSLGAVGAALLAFVI